MPATGSPSLHWKRAVPVTGAYRVEMRWGVWWMLALFGCAMFAIPFTLALGTLGKPDAGAVPWVAGGFAVLALAAVLNHLAEGARVANAGFILRANAQGLAVRGLPMIGWRSVVGLDLLLVHAHLGKHHHALLVALDAPTALRLAAGWWRARGLNAKRQLLVVPLSLARQDPQQVLESTRAVAAWAGAPLTDWTPLVQVSTAMAARQAGVEAGQAVRGATARMAGLLADIEAGPGPRRTEAMRRMVEGTDQTLASARALLQAQDRLQQESASSLRRYLWAGAGLLALAALAYTMVEGG